jgi:nicotinamide mononucleotide transporter
VPASLPEWIAVALALAYLLLAIRQSRWCWPAAALSSAIYLVLFATGGLPMQAALQAFYIATSAYGWYAWRAAQGESRQLHVTTRPWPWHVAALGCVVVLTAANVYLLPGSGGLLVSSADAFVAWGSVLATWMVARKILENWFYWVFFDLAAAALYFVQGFHATAGLFLLYVVLAGRGFVAWRADMRRHAPAATN